jgi:hypothetical protein
MQYVPPKRVDFSELLVNITHKTVLSIVTAVRTSKKLKSGIRGTFTVPLYMGIQYYDIALSDKGDRHNFPLTAE